MRTQNWRIGLLLFVLTVPYALAGQASAAATSPAIDSAAPAASAAPSTAEKETAANLEKARRTLKYGIDSMVVSVINQAKESKDKRLVPEILSTLDSLNPDVQKAAIDYFIGMQDWTAHVKITAMLDAYNDYPIEVAVRLLKFIQEQKAAASGDLMDRLIQMSQSAKVDLQAAAVDAIAACGTVDQMEGLIKLFKKSGTASAVRSAIIRAMGKFSTPDGTALLKDIIGDTGEEKSLRYEAITALGKQGQMENINLIKPSLTSKDVYERGAAINALAGFPLDKVIILYQQALRDELWRNRVSVLKVINDKKIGELEDAVMFSAEDDPEKPVKFEAIRTLATLNGAKGWDLLRRLFLESKTGDETRGVIAEQLISKNFLDSREAVAKVMESEWSKDTSYLLNIIGRELAASKNAAAVDLYARMLEHPNFIVKIYGVRGIKETARDSYRARLQEMLEAKPVPALKSSLEDALK